MLQLRNVMYVKVRTETQFLAMPFLRLEYVKSAQRRSCFENTQVQKMFTFCTGVLHVQYIYVHMIMSMCSTMYRGFYDSASVD